MKHPSAPLKRRCANIKRRRGEILDLGMRFRGPGNPEKKDHDRADGGGEQKCRITAGSYSDEGNEAQCRNPQNVHLLLTSKKELKG